ncbi:unnamed protein product [Kuraishia capsulata CBS 1993]|uniref:Zn(2)-C6 fungal-type domain-containing protein n=1 Tax=Kuraishia capsulata CBS 1993 TaxID=1382522 RepID=W6MPH4_9ASCO|nr:uncharacterized protein KUCA_T00004588001 [Kuraishia capsulata CBS 1993]CDK28604.1 unnamed protein product [Kuraishia capsulata CBS 1993]
MAHVNQAEEPVYGKRARTAKACDYCRKKKIKCDGTSPCSNCTSYETECSYTYVTKKRTTKRKRPNTSKNKNVQELEKRLGKMESLIEQLVFKISAEDVGKLRHKHVRSTSEESITTADEEEEEDGTDVDTSHDGDAEDEDDGEDEEEEAEEHEESLQNGHQSDQSGLNSVSAKKEPFKDRFDAVLAALPTPPTDGKKVSRANQGTLKQHYVARHSSFSVFSEQGIDWVASRLQDKTAMYPLHVLMRKARRVEDQSSALFIEPIESSKLSPLPPKDLTAYLLKYIIQNSCGRFFNLDVDQVVAVFGRLNNFREGKIRDPHFSYSELFLMNMTTTVILALHHGTVVFNSVPTEEIPEEFTQENISEAENKYLINSLYYFQRVSLVNDGLLGIQCILLLATYADSALLSKSATTILTVAIKQAQELGLHRAETLIGLPEREKENRIRLFWWCFTLDRDMGLKFGSPLMIRDSDISCPGMKAYSRFWSYNYPPSLEYYKGGINRRETMRDEICAQLTKAVFEDSSWNFVEDFILHDLSTITGKVYEHLYSGSVLIGKSSQEIHETIISLLKDLENWRMLVPETLRPGSRSLVQKLNDSVNGSDAFRLLRVLFIHFRYYSLKILITRIVFNSDWPGTAKHQNLRSEIAATCLDASRTILALSDAIGTRFSCFSNWILFYPFTAFLCLFGNCIQNASENYVLGDVTQMIKVARGFFVFEGERTLRSKWGLVEIIVRNLLFIVITAVEEARGRKGMFDVGDYLDEVKSIAEDEKKRSCKSKSQPIKRNVSSSNIDYSNFEGRMAGDLEMPDQASEKRRHRSRSNLCHFPSISAPSIEHVITASGGAEAYSTPQFGNTALSASDIAVVTAAETMPGAFGSHINSNNSPNTNGSESNVSDFSMNNLMTHDLTYSYSNLFNLAEYFLDFEAGGGGPGVFTPTDGNLGTDMQTNLSLAGDQNDSFVDF